MMPGPPPVMTAKPGLRQQPPYLHRGGVLRIVGRRPRRAEHRHGRADLGERVEAVDELAHDPQDPPRVGVQERRILPAQEVLVRRRRPPRPFHGRRRYSTPELRIAWNRATSSAVRVRGAASSTCTPACASPFR